jgi:hypothetical protein
MEASLTDSEEHSCQPHNHEDEPSTGGAVEGAARLDMDEFAAGSLETTQAPSQRSAFLAGFCYYEMGRHASMETPSVYPSSTFAPLWAPSCSP